MHGDYYSVKKTLPIILLLLIIGAGVLFWSSSLAPEGSHYYPLVVTPEPVKEETAESAEAVNDFVSIPADDSEPEAEPVEEYEGEDDYDYGYESAEKPAEPSSATSVLPASADPFAPGIHKSKYSQMTEIYGEQYLEYNVVVPNNVTENMALVIYLPGDNSNDRVDEVPFREFAQRISEYYGDDFNFIMLLPVTRYFEWHGGWIAEVLKGLIDNTIEQYKIDPSRVAITGYSRGAEGAWLIVEDFGDYFSCCVPVSCGADLHNYDSFKNVPVWAMYGDGQTDSWTFGPDIKYYVQRINEAGGNAKYTIVEGHDHDSMGYAAYTKEVIEWMLSQ